MRKIMIRIAILALVMSMAFTVIVNDDEKVATNQKNIEKFTNSENGEEANQTLIEALGCRFKK